MRKFAASVTNDSTAQVTEEFQKTRRTAEPASISRRPPLSFLYLEIRQQETGIRSGWLACYLVDTNVLLDGCFISYSWSANYLNKAVNKGDTLYTTIRATEEAKTMIAKYITALRDPTHFYLLLSQKIQAFGIDLIQDHEGISPASIPKNDAFLWPTAKSCNLNLLTRDLALLKAFREAGREAFTPIELITMNEPAHRYLFGGVAPSSEAGTLYFHGRDDHWATNITKPVNILHLGEDIFLDYTPSKRTWTVSGAAIDQQIEYTCSSDFDARLPKKVAVTWGGGKLQVFDSSQQAASNRFCVDLCDFGEERSIQIGNVLPPRTGFMGTVQALIFDDRPLSKKLWRKIRDEGPAFTPQPFDNDRLRERLRKM